MISNWEYSVLAADAMIDRVFSRRRGLSPWIICCLFAISGSAPCAPIQNTPPRNEQIIALVSISEGIRALKTACEARFPEFGSQNDAAYLASPYSHPFVESLTSPEEAVVLREKARRRFPNYFDEVRQKYLDSHPATLKRDCSQFPQLLEKYNVNVQRLMNP